MIPDMLTFTGSIKYTMRDTHPDLKYGKLGKVYTYSDVYSFSGYTIDYCKEIVEFELLLIANGGYELGHIDIIDISIELVE